MAERSGLRDGDLVTYIAGKRLPASPYSVGSLVDVIKCAAATAIPPLTAELAARLCCESGQHRMKGRCDTVLHLLGLATGRRVVIRGHFGVTRFDQDSEPGFRAADGSRVRPFLVHEEATAYACPGITPGGR